MVRPEGIEPPTPGSEVRCSIQLSYGRVSYFKHFDEGLVKDGITVQPEPFLLRDIIEQAHTRVNTASTN